MSRFNTIIGISVIVAAVIILTPFSNLQKCYLIGIELIALLAVLTLGAFRINSQMFVRTICKRTSEKTRIAITFDDGPHEIHTPRILEILQKYDCCASFFIIGKKAESNEDIVRDMFAAGHSIGNHSYEHSNVFPLLSGKKIAEEIAKTSDILQGITGTKVKYFRPPFGVTNPLINSGLRDSGLKVIGWSVRSFDTKNEGAGTVVKRITRRLRGGDIILLHDTSDHILDILEQFMQEIEKSGFWPVSLDTMLKD